MTYLLSSAFPEDPEARNRVSVRQPFRLGPTYFGDEWKSKPFYKICQQLSSLVPCRFRHCEGLGKASYGFWGQLLVVGQLQVQLNQGIMISKLRDFIRSEIVLNINEIEISIEFKLTTLPLIKPLHPANHLYILLKRIS